jgi:hypothetical protein
LARDGAGMPPHVERRDTRHSDEMRVVSGGIVSRTFNYPVLLGNLIGTCREVLTTIELPSGQVRLMIVSRIRKNFSASMCVASLVGFAP